MTRTLQLLIQKCSMFIESSVLGKERRLNFISGAIISTIEGFLSRGKEESLAIFMDDIDYQNDPISILKTFPGVFGEMTKTKTNFTRRKMLLLSGN